MSRPADARPLGPETPAEVVEAFHAAVVTAFQELTDTAVEPADAYRSATAGPPAAVHARIDLRGAVPGRLTLVFPRPVLTTLTRRYLPADIPVTPDLIADAAGEFANVIAGQAKTMLKGTPHHYALSTPTVTVAEEPDGDALTLAYACDAGPFTLRLVVPSGG